MSVSTQPIRTSSPAISPAVLAGAEIASDNASLATGKVAGRRSAWQFLETLISTLMVFALFFVQAIIVARILGPAGRGEFGTILYFPRDLLLYVGLWGGVELMTALAAQSRRSTLRLKKEAMRMACFTGLSTAALAIVLATIVLVIKDRLYLLPACALVALYLPLEHMQLIVSAVDRGSGRFSRYNRDRVLFAASFPLTALTVFGLGWNQWLPISSLSLLCWLWFASRLLGVLPTIYDLFWTATNSDRDASKDSKNEMPRVAGAAENRVSLRMQLRQGRSYAWSMLATEVFERLDLLLVIFLASLDQSGQYFVALPIATLLVLVPNTVSLFAFNWGARVDKRVGIIHLVALTMGLLLVQLASYAVLLLMLPWLIQTFYGSDFQLTVAFCQWLFPVAIVRGLVQIVDAFAKGSGNLSWSIGSRIGATVITLLVVALTYPYWGLLAIPLGMGFGQLFCLAMIGYGCLRELGRRNSLTAAAISSVPDAGGKT